MSGQRNRRTSRLMDHIRHWLGAKAWPGLTKPRREISNLVMRLLSQHSPSSGGGGGATCCFRRRKSARCLLDALSASASSRAESFFSPRLGWPAEWLLVRHQREAGGARNERRRPQNSHPRGRLVALEAS